MRDCAFFPPGLHPVLDGGKGDKHPMIAPQVPTGGTVGQAVFNDNTHGQVDDPMGVMSAGWGYIGQIDVEMLLAGGAIVRRKGHHEVNGTVGAQITYSAGHMA